jgi:prepilin-type N-terminal cleavage/methylation domain-containing protein
MTMVELVVVLAVAGILMGGGAFALSRFGTRDRIGAEAGKVVDALWEMRARATTGMRNPCMDFPAPDSVRVYSDTSSSPDGFGAGDRVLGGFRFRGGVRALDIAGGQGANHAVCFESRGMMGSTAKALLITLGIDGGNPETKRVRLLPSTGVAKVL